MYRVIKRGLDIFVFNVQKCDDKTFSSHKESLDFLRELGFKVVDNNEVFSDIYDAIKRVEEIGNKRSELSYDIDGAVIKVNSLTTHFFVNFSKIFSPIKVQTTS